MELSTITLERLRQLDQLTSADRLEFRDAIITSKPQKCMINNNEGDIRWVMGIGITEEVPEGSYDLEDLSAYPTHWCSKDMGGTYERLKSGTDLTYARSIRDDNGRHSHYEFGYSFQVR